MFRSAPFVLHSAKVGDSSLIYVIKDVEAHLHSLRTPATKRRCGSARRAMQAFLAWTDSLRLPVYLAASPLDDRTSGARLVNFYRSLGFIETGEFINPVRDPVMRRDVGAKPVRPNPDAQSFRIVRQVHADQGMLHSVELLAMDAGGEIGFMEIEELILPYRQALTIVAMQRELQCQCVNDYERACNFAGFPLRMFGVGLAFIHKEQRNLGVGIELYTAGAHWAAERNGAIMSMRCSVGSGTSSLAERAWRSRRLAERVAVFGEIAYAGERRTA